MDLTVAHLFCGAGGGGLGFRRAGFRGVGAIDSDPAACRDFELLTGERATEADIGAMSPADLRDIFGEAAPDVVFTSPPCKGFSGCLPGERAKTPHYMALNSLAFRGVWMLLEAWKTPPPLILLENVPRIQSRGRQWLDQIVALLHSYGYAVSETTHDCGVLGGLAQRRRRFLLVARHMPQVEQFLRVPPPQRVRGCGEVLGQLPPPGSTTGGPMHRLPRLSALNWVRLALIPAGGDWKDIPASVGLPERSGRPNGPFGVENGERAAHAVLGHTSTRDTWGSVADPRVTCTRRSGSMGVTGWGDVSTTVIGHGILQNGPWQVGDPRLGCSPRRGTLGVTPWATPSHTVRGSFTTGNSPAAVADPRVPAIDGPPIDLEDRSPTNMVIVAEDGTWHRPMTTLELAALQGFPTRIDGGWLKLDGKSHKDWRQRIGNAVPPPTAEAIAKSCAETLTAARSGEWGLSSHAIWVRRHNAESHTGGSC